MRAIVDADKWIFIAIYKGMRLGYETSRCEEEEFESEENNNDARRKVTLDPSLVQNMLNFSDEESDEEITSPRYAKWQIIGRNSMAGLIYRKIPEIQIAE